MLQRIKSAALMLAALLASGGAGADAALEALNGGDHLSAFEAFSARAAAGDAKAQNNLGVMYLRGQGTEQDYDRAMYWFQQAADLGLRGALHNLAMMYLRGYGRPADAAAALPLFEQAARRGDRESQFYLATLLHEGNGAEADPVAAAMWFRQAAEQELDAAQFNLALMYLEGDGIANDIEQAVTWLERAAAQDHEPAMAALAQIYLDRNSQWHDMEAGVALVRRGAEAGAPDLQTRLGALYSIGYGVEQDSAEALFWLTLAARQGSALAQLSIGDLHVRGLNGADGSDPVEAYAWYRLSAATGFTPAGDRAEQLRQELDDGGRARAEARFDDLQAEYLAPAGGGAE
ncbi:MAG: sel1 repeat family protein [Gammaproteobacteria bacterium]|nr:sel1 repeat family protein [Gammaproteobacteria bacterium]